MININLMDFRKYCLMMTIIKILSEFWSIKVILFLSKMILLKINNKNKLLKKPLSPLIHKKSEKLLFLFVYFCCFFIPNHFLLNYHFFKLLDLNKSNL